MVDRGDQQQHGGRQGEGNSPGKNKNPSAIAQCHAVTCKALMFHTRERTWDAANRLVDIGAYVFVAALAR